MFDKLSGELEWWIGNDGLDIDPRLSLHQEINAALASWTTIIDKIRSPNSATGLTQDVDNPAGAARRLPNVLRQLLYLQKSVHGHIRRLVKVILTISQRRALYLAGMVKHSVLP